MTKKSLKTDQSTPCSLPANLPVENLNKSPVDVPVDSIFLIFHNMIILNIKCMITDMAIVEHEFMYTC